jgi:hypothetical protein
MALPKPASRPATRAHWDTSSKPNTQISAAQPVNFRNPQSIHDGGSVRVTNALFCRCECGVMPV